MGESQDGNPIGKALNNKKGIPQAAFMFDQVWLIDSDLASQV